MASIDISLQPDTRQLQIVWEDGRVNRFHYVWLRHHARCANGMPNDTSVKLDLLPDDPAALQIDDHVLETETLILKWHDDALVTRHNLGVLRQSAYDRETRMQRKAQPVLWVRDTAAVIPDFGFDDLQDDTTRLELLLALRDYGLVRLHDVPAEAGTISRVATCFGPVHVNNYGEIFDVRSDAKLNLGSNTGHFLPPHTDESYRHGAPGISFFHCLEASPRGGESILVDGFEAARILRSEDPESFDVLTSIPVFFQRYALPLEDMRSHARVIVTDIDVVGVRWTDRTLPPQDLPGELVEPVYRALRRMWRIINTEDLWFQYRLSRGELHIFDNHRVLHGRQAFDPQTGPRHLQQCTVGRDEYHNSLRLLAARLQHPAADQVMAGGAG